MENNPTEVLKPALPAETLKSNDRMELGNLDSSNTKNTDNMESKNQLSSREPEEHSASQYDGDHAYISSQNATIASSKSNQTTPRVLKQPSSRAFLQKIQRIEATTRGMGTHDLRNLLYSHKGLNGIMQEEIKKHVDRELESLSIDHVVRSIGKDEAIWTQLVAKHENLRTFLSVWHRRKLDEKKGIVPKPPGEKSVGQIQRELKKKEMRKMRKLEKEAQKSKTGHVEKPLPSALQTQDERRMAKADLQWEKSSGKAMREVEQSKRVWLGAQQNENQEYNEADHDSEIEGADMEDMEDAAQASE